MAGPTNQLGEAVITVRVDDSGVGPGFATAVTKAQSAASQTVVSASNVDTIVNESRRADEAIEVGFVKSFKRARASVTSFIGAAAGIAGISFMAYRVGQAIREYIIDVLSTGTEKAERFISTLDFSKPAESAAQLQKELDSVNERLAGSSESMLSQWLNGIVGDTSASLKEESDRLQKSLVISRGAANASVTRKRTQEEQEANKKIAEEQQRNQAQIVSEEERNRIERRDEADRDAAEKKKELEDFYADLERREYEAMERAAKRREELMQREERAIQNLRTQAANLFPTDQITTSLEAVVAKLDRIAQQTRSRL